MFQQPTKEADSAPCDKRARHEAVSQSELAARVTAFIAAEEAANDSKDDHGKQHRDATLKSLIEALAALPATADNSDELATALVAAANSRVIGLECLPPVVLDALPLAGVVGTKECSPFVHLLFAGHAATVKHLVAKRGKDALFPPALLGHAFVGACCSETAAVGLLTFLLEDAQCRIIPPQDALGPGLLCAVGDQNLEAVQYLLQNDTLAFSKKDIQQADTKVNYIGKRPREVRDELHELFGAYLKASVDRKKGSKSYKQYVDEQRAVWARGNVEGLAAFERAVAAFDLAAPSSCLEALAVLDALPVPLGSPGDAGNTAVVSALLKAGAAVVIAGGICCFGLDSSVELQEAAIRAWETLYRGTDPDSQLALVESTQGVVIRALMEASVFEDNEPAAPPSLARFRALEEKYPWVGDTVWCYMALEGFAWLNTAGTLLPNRIHDALPSVMRDSGLFGSLFSDDFVSDEDW